MFKFWITLAFCLSSLVGVDAFACQTTQVYGVQEQAHGNCAMLGGSVTSCTVMNWKTGYQTCRCVYNCDAGGGYDAPSSCRTTQVYGVREQAHGNCAMLGGSVTSCTVMNWKTGYQTCGCSICR